MEERSSGIILRTHPLTETSLIVNWLTSDLGRISTVAKGARRPKSPFSGKLDLYYEADFSVIRSRKSALHILKEVVVTNNNSHLRFEYAAFTQAAYFTTLIELATERESPLPELWGLLKDSLLRLRNSPTAPSILFSFEFDLLMSQGYQPNLESLSKEAMDFLQKIKTPQAAEVHDRSVLNEVNKWLRNAIAHNFNKIPAQRPEAIRLLAGRGKF